jgi:glycosyltransferase involved in cell wall biosynthesis
MRVAFISQPTSDFVIPPRGSITIWIHEVARRLTSSCEVIIYARRGQHQSKLEHMEGVQYRRVSLALDGLVRKVARRMSKFGDVESPFFASSWNYFWYGLQVAKDVRSQRCDVVHIINFSQLAPIIRALNPKIKIVLHMHCEWLTQLNRTLIERRLKVVDSVVGCSEYITERIRRRFPKFSGLYQTVYNGTDVVHFIARDSSAPSRGNHSKRVLFVGRVSPEKGLHLLVDAFQKVVEHHPDAQLEIVGPREQLSLESLVALSDDPMVSGLASFYEGSSPTNYFTRLTEQLEALKIEDQVSFAGPLRHGEVINRYRDAAVVVNPSFSESFGMSLVEAMSCQVPVVATRVGGMQEIAEGSEVGLLVEPGDAQALADAIIRLLSNEGLRRSIGKAGRQRAIECFSWDRIAKELLEHYRSLCGIGEYLPRQA